MDWLYTAEATAYGARTGTVVSGGGRLDLQLSRPAVMAGDDGPGTNPEQLFAAGYAACFHSALRFGAAAAGLRPGTWAVARGGCTGAPSGAPRSGWPGRSGTRRRRAC